MDLYVELPHSSRVYYLDTCVWSALGESDETKTRFVTHFQSNDYVAALSHFTLFELSRAPARFGDLDPLFFDMRYHVWTPCLYDQVVESELGSYPNIWTMRWLPVSVFVDESNPNLISTLASNPLFAGSRNDHLRFGDGALSERN